MSELLAREVDGRIRGLHRLQSGSERGDPGKPPRSLNTDQVVTFCRRYPRPEITIATYDGRTYRVDWVRSYPPDCGHGESGQIVLYAMPNFERSMGALRQLWRWLTQKAWRSERR